jgi:hypothetical protein
VTEPESQRPQQVVPTHCARRMRGRDPQEQTGRQRLWNCCSILHSPSHSGVAAPQFAHGLADNHVEAALIAFCYCALAISWAWINFSWFASAYDTDDWIYRLTTMLQMVGVIVWWIYFV